MSVWGCVCVHAVPEYTIRCGEIKGAAISFFNISNIHLNRCDTHSYSIVLQEKKHS